MSYFTWQPETPVCVGGITYENEAGHVLCMCPDCVKNVPHHANAVIREERAKAATHFKRAHAAGEAAAAAAAAAMAARNQSGFLERVPLA